MSVPFEKELEALAQELYDKSVDFPPKEVLPDVLKRVLLPLLRAGQAMRDENEKYLDWLESLAKRAEEQAVAWRNLPTLVEACLADAKNYRATGNGKRKYTAAWDAAREHLAQLEKR